MTINIHSSRDLLKQIIWNRLWQTKSTVNEELKRITEKYISLKKDFLAKDDITWEELYTFEKLDDPLKNEVTLQAVLHIEKAMQLIPLDKIDNLTLLTKEECHQLLLAFSSVSVQAQTQFLIYSWKYMKYDHASNYLFEVLAKEKTEALEETYKSFLDNSSKINDRIMQEKDTELAKITKKHEKARLEKEKELQDLVNDWQLTSMEKKNELKNFDSDFNYQFSEVNNRYKIRADEERANEWAKAKIVYDKMKRSAVSIDISIDEVYNEFLQKKEIIKQTRDYFSMSLDLLRNFQFNVKAIFDKLI